MKCSGKIKYKQGRRMVEAKCPYNELRCVHYRIMGKDRRPVEVKRPGECEHHEIRKIYTT